MTSMIDRGTLDRMIALGRERGELTAEEFQAALPVESMDVDALVLMMLELEAAGISVESKVFGPRADRPVPLAPELPSASANASRSHTRVAEGGPIPARPGPRRRNRLKRPMLPARETTSIGSCCCPASPPS